MNNKNNPFTYSSANDATGFLLYKVHNYWQREIKRALKKLNITHTQYVIMASAYWLILKKGGVTQIEIANLAEMDVMMTSNVIRTLEKKELLIREAHKTDTRAKIVKLTEKGIEILNKAVKKVENFDRDFFNKLKDSEKFNKELIRLLNKK